MQINKYRSHIIISLLSLFLLFFCINLYFKEREVQQQRTVADPELKSTDNEANSKDDKLSITAQEQKQPAQKQPEQKPVRNAIASLAKKEDIQDSSDPSTLKKLLIKKGIYFGDFLGNEDVELAAPRPANFLTQINQYFNLYTVPAWFHHVELKNRHYDFKGID